MTTEQTARPAPSEPVALGKLAELVRRLRDRALIESGYSNPSAVLMRNAADALANTEAQMRELEQWRQLATDPAAVRVNLLRGTLAKPDDLIFMHDTNGPYAALEAQMRGMRERIAEQDRVMELLYTQAAEGNDHVGQLHDKIGSLQAMVSELEKALALSREQHAM